MQLQIEPPRGGRLKVVALALTSVLAALALRRPLAGVAGLALGAAVLGFVALPLANLYEQRLSRPISALLSLATIGLACAGLLWLLLPTVLQELVDFARALPRSVGRIAQWMDFARDRLAARLPGVPLPDLDFKSLEGALSGVAMSAFSALSRFAGAVGRLSVMAVLAYFFLCDREGLLLRLELLLPSAVRSTAVRMANAAVRELRLYLRGQLMIAAVVGLMSVAALTLVGVRSALVLGVIIGLLNMIPYFGPYIGGIPAVLIALGDGWQKAALTALALAAVQQLDSAWISPRIMSSLTGFSPALVLVGIYAGARVAGIPGMLCALPLMLTARTLFRVFVQKSENI